MKQHCYSFKTKLLILILFFINHVRCKDRIVGGSLTTIQQFPYQLSLRYNGMHVCGAVILNENFGLTAAHCIKPGNYSVRAGSSFLNEGGIVIPISKVFIHPSFNHETDDYDIAVLQFYSPLNFSEKIQPVKLPPESLPYREGEMGFITGWGATNYKLPQVTMQLRAVQVPVISMEYCRFVFDSTDITSRMFCAGYREGDKDACQGDSGGPFVVNGVLYGLVSWGIDCASPRYPGVYTNVANLRDYIRNNAGI